MTARKHWRMFYQFPKSVKNVMAGHRNFHTHFACVTFCKKNVQTWKHRSWNVCIALVTEPVSKTKEFHGEAHEPSLVLILKWGGELTPAGKLQAEELGKAFRCMYPGGQGKLISCWSTWCVQWYSFLAWLVVFFVSCKYLTFRESRPEFWVSFWSGFYDVSIVISGLSLTTPF